MLTQPVMTAWVYGTCWMRYGHIIPLFSCYRWILVAETCNGIYWIAFSDSDNFSLAFLTSFWQVRERGQKKREKNRLFFKTMKYKKIPISVKHRFIPISIKHRFSYCKITTYPFKTIVLHHKILCVSINIFCKLKMFWNPFRIKLAANRWIILFYKSLIFMFTCLNKLWTWICI